jgi:uncharacterized protein (TIGR02270 family)
VRFQRPAIDEFVRQHVEDAAHLRRLRTRLLRSPTINLRQLTRWDERLAAHLDGIAVAGSVGTRLTLAGLERVDVGVLFVACVRTLEDGDSRTLAKLLAVSAGIPDIVPGVTSAFGWVSAGRLKGIVGQLFQSTSAWDRRLALTACGMHRVDPGSMLRSALGDVDGSVRARALRVAALCARTDLLSECLAALSDPEEGCASEAAVSAVLLGDRGEAVERLEQAVVSSAIASVNGERASTLLFRALAPVRSRAVLRTMSRAGAVPRLLIRGFAAAGDPDCVPWLIERMKDEELARVAGEAFTFITGADLQKAGLTRDVASPAAPDQASAPADNNSEDEGVHWPDHTKVLAWWNARQGSFEPGKRYLFGREPSRERCYDVLAAGTQRQRQAAAFHLVLLHPGTPIFDTAAPAWRQRRALSSSNTRGE